MGRMRRMLVCTLALLVAAVLPTAPAFAQFGLVGPGGIVNYSVASTTCVNSVAECTLYSYSVPTGLIATSSLAPATSTVTAANVAGSPPLHFVARGILNVGSGVTNMAVNYGGSTASLALVNGITLGTVTAQPVQVDVWIAPLATGFSANTVTVKARLAYQLGATFNTASEVVYNAQVIGTTSLKTANTLSVLWRFNTATNSNSIVLHQRSLSVGD